ncbi:MAG: rhodanese-like domain-containing protein [Euryarchaeota archaeon]|nr:rhodanese-like domain-containing protein [Euryarchaeota archaeon]
MNKYIYMPLSLILLLIITPIASSIPYTNITSEEAFNMGLNKNTVFIDVRGYKDFIKEKIKMPRVFCTPYWSLFSYKDDFREGMGDRITLTLFSKILKNKNVIFYCNIGKTSEDITKHFLLYEMFSDSRFYNLIGGIKAWEEAGYPVSKF